MDQFFSKFVFYGKLQENTILHYKSFLQNMCRNLKILTDVKNEKTNIFAIGPVVFAPRNQTYARTRVAGYWRGNFLNSKMHNKQT
jgi:hypothetical protein